MVCAIVAVGPDYGIGLEERLPWHCPEELESFRRITEHGVLVVGRRTAKTLPKLRHRTILSIGSDPSCDLHSLRDIVPADKVFIAGGARLYASAFAAGIIDRLYLSVMKPESLPHGYHCDTYFDPQWLRQDEFVIVSQDNHTKFIQYVLVPSASLASTHPQAPLSRSSLSSASQSEWPYLELLCKVMQVESAHACRNGVTKSTFGETLVFDIADGAHFPLLTTKRMFMRGIVEELLFFLRGDTDTTHLANKGVRIWEGNTTRAFLDSRNLPYAEGVMGPMYGYQWRWFNAPYTIDAKGYPMCSESQGIDQIANVVRTIQTDPHSRRILLTAYNPAQAEEGVLYPCHSVMIQFHVDGTQLDMLAVSRSCDLFLGAPFNIASYALLLMIIAKLTHTQARRLKIVLGDAHIYQEHYTAVVEQLSRLPYRFPRMTLRPHELCLKDIDKLTADDFVLSDYTSHASIKAPMVP